MGSQFVLATGGYDRQIRLFDAQDATPLRSVRFNDSQVLQLAFSGAGPVEWREPLFLAVAGSPLVAVYNVSTPNSSPLPVFEFKEHKGPVTAVGFEPSTPPAFGYSASEDGTLQVWDPRDPARGDGRLGATHGSDVAGPSVYTNQAQPDASGSQNPATRSQQSRVWEFTNWSESAEDKSSRVPINAAVYLHAANMFFTADSSGRVRAWDFARKKRIGEMKPGGSGRHLQTLELSNDGTRLVTANADGHVFVLDVHDLLSRPDKCLLATFSADKGKKVYVTRTRLSPNGCALACTLGTGFVRIFNLADVLSNHIEETNEPCPASEAMVQARRSFRAHRGWVWDAVFVGDNASYLFTCSTNTQVCLWNLTGAEPTSTEYPGHAKAVVCLAMKERYHGAGMGAP